MAKPQHSATSTSPSTSTDSNERPVFGNGQVGRIEHERPVDLDEPTPAPEKREDDYVRLTLRSVEQHPKAKDQAELPGTARVMYQGKTIALTVGEKGKVMTRGCANHFIRKALTWSYKADLLLEDVR